MLQQFRGLSALLFESRPAWLDEVIQQCFRRGAHNVGAARHLNVGLISSTAQGTYSDPFDVVPAN